MAEIHDTLRRLLENPELKNALAEAFYTGIEPPSTFANYDLAEHLRHVPRHLWDDELVDVRATDVPEYCWDPSLEGVRTKVAEAIQTIVIDKLPQPAPITVEDIVSVAESQLAGVPLLDSTKNDENARAYRRFIEFTVVQIAKYYDVLCVKRFSLGYWKHCNESDLEQICDAAFCDSTELRVWTSASGFRLSVLSPYKGCETPAGFDQGNSAEFLGGLTGFCTPRAAERANELNQFATQSIVKSLALSLHAYQPPITALIWGEGPRMISTCLSALWPQPASNNEEKGGIQNRLRNAIILLSYADQAGADPVALSLSFAAIESLVCEKDELPVNKQIKRHVATLLVQDTNARKACEKVVGGLYDIRSQVMHGNRISASVEASHSVRTIAAGVLRSVASWMDNQERMGGDTSWKEFLDEVNAGSRKPGIVVGVSDLSDLIPDKVPT